MIAITVILGVTLIGAAIAIRRAWRKLDDDETVKLGLVGAWANTLIQHHGDTYKHGSGNAIIEYNNHGIRIDMGYINESGERKRISAEWDAITNTTDCIITNEMEGE